MGTTEQTEDASCTTCISFSSGTSSICSKHNVVVHRPDKSCAKYERKETVEPED